MAWIELTDEVPPEAYASALMALATASKPRAVLSTTRPQDRSLMGAVAAALDAVLVPGVLGMSLESGTVVLQRDNLGGRVIETLVIDRPVVGLFGGDDTSASAPTVTPHIERLDVESPPDIRIEKNEPVDGGDAGVTNAERVVAVGRGLKAKSDLALMEHLATRLDASLGCSMPIADDFGWVPKERYIGRSGQHIAPRLYVAVGISGAPQHLDGVRDAKTVVAVNDDPEAHIFRRADYGVVGDLYAVIPALEAALDGVGET